MRRTACFVIALALVYVPVAFSGTTIVPTTTLAAETGNNTSTSTLFVGTANGNPANSNVSKVDAHKLMYPGFNGKIYAHLMGWFCMQSGSTAIGAGTQCNNHVQVGYNSADPAVVHAQVTDMISRGFDGAIHDWYGPGNLIDNESKALMNEAQLHPGYSFAIMIDKGAIQWNSCINSGCTATQALTQLTQYVANTYFNSPAYMRINGRPVLTNFDIDLHYSVDWNYVAANTPGNPIFLFQNNGGFTHTLSSGSYSWVMPGDSNYGLDYLGSFYSTGMNYPSEWTVGAMYKGFNDTLASWSGNRIMSQQCGQTWLQTFDKANSMFNTSNQLEAIQLVTWDDYEEGTEIETGIDNCFSVSGGMTGASTLKWTINGNENTIDHYTVFISTDGQNLMSLGDFTVGVRQVDLAQYSLPFGTYTLYVKTTGKPSMRNQMTPAVTYAYTPGVHITSPADGATVPSSVHVTGYAISGNGAVTAMAIYVDGKDPWAYEVNASSLDTYLNLNAGQHTIAINAWDWTGAVTQSQVVVTVAAQPPTAVLSVSQTSALTFTASTTGSTDPNGSTLTTSVNWGDGYVASGSTQTHTYAKAGVYTITATVTDSYGLSANASKTVTAAGVVIWLPTPGSTDRSPVHVAATAYDTNRIASMIVYVDGNQKYLIYSNSLDTKIKMNKGTHNIVINAWEDVTGIVFQSKVTVIVP